MRDVLLVGIFAVLLLTVFRHPVIGAYLWAWFSLMNPHRMTWGFAYTLPFAQIIAGVTTVALLLTRKRQALPLNGITLLWLGLVLWMCLTTPFALNESSIVMERWIFVMKIHFMLLVSLMLVTTAAQLRMLVAIVALSVCFFGIKGGIFTIATAGAYHVWGPEGMLGGNNEFAVGLVMLVPYLYWLQQTSQHKWVRRGLGVAMLLCLLSILGTQSRGALLAVGAAAVFLGLKSRRPWAMTLLIAVAVVLGVVFMPDSWSDRMETIGSFREDSSAMSRLWVWNTLWNVAVDRPLVGAGFRADAAVVFSTYAPTGGQWAGFASSGTYWVAHSIYFQMLGEHGFVGLGLFLGLWTTVWVQAGRLARRAETMEGLAGWMPLLMRMTQVSLIGYGVGGAFLSLAYLDVPYYCMGFVVAAGALVTRARPAPLAAATSATATPAIRSATRAGGPG